MPIGPFLTAVAPAAISAVSGFISQMFAAKEARREYSEMRDYNTPKAQMERYREAGLSPYLIYSQGNSGNVTSPQPGRVAPDVSGSFQQGLENYMSMSAFAKDMDLKDAQIRNARIQSQNMLSSGEKLHWDNVRKSLDLLSDYPDMTEFNSSAAATGFRRKVNELKLSTSLAQLSRIEAATEGMRSRNVVDAVRAGYARDYGMVGGDWTQGLGLIKSLPSFFKGARKAPTDPMEKSIIDRYRKMQKSTLDRKANRYLFEQFKP